MTSFKRRTSATQPGSASPPQKRRLEDASRGVPSQDWKFDGELYPDPSPSLLQIANIAEARHKLPPVMFVNAVVRVRLAGAALLSGCPGAALTCEAQRCTSTTSRSRPAAHDHLSSALPVFVVVCWTTNPQLDEVCVYLVPRLTHDRFCVDDYASYTIQVCLNGTALHSQRFHTLLLPEPCRVAPPELMLVDASTGSPVTRFCLRLDSDIEDFQMQHFGCGSLDVDRHSIMAMLKQLGDGVYTLYAQVLDEDVPYFGFSRKVVFLKCLLQMKWNTFNFPIYHHLMMSPNLDACSLRVSLCWGGRPRKLDLHMICSNGEHICHSLDYTGSGDQGEADAELEVLSTDGLGPCTIVLRNPEPDAIYQFYVQHRAAAWADFQHRAYKGQALYDSNAHVFVWDCQGILLDCLPLPLRAESEQTIAEDCFWWNLFTIDPRNKTVFLHNCLTDRAPSLGALKRQLRASRAAASE